MLSPTPPRLRGLFVLAAAHLLPLLLADHGRPAAAAAAADVAMVQQHRPSSADDALTSPDYTLSSFDSTIQVTLSQSTGLVYEISALGHVLPGLGSLSDMLVPDAILLNATVEPTSSSVRVVRLFSAKDETSESVTIRTLSEYYPLPHSVGVNVSISCASCSAPFTVPLSTMVEFNDTSTLKLWAPWDRESFSHNPPSTDALDPSDGHFSWWSGKYKYGSVVSNGFSDMVTAPTVSFLHNASNTAFSLHLDPYDPWAELAMLTSGPTMHQREQGSISGSVEWRREQLRITPDKSFNLSMQLHAHESCWRPALNFSLQTYEKLWRPAEPDLISNIEGLGSYSWFLGNLNSSFQDMGYGLDWDLGGRFFPYMGQYLPPLPQNGTWENDPEGSQQHQNVSFSLIDDYYSRLQKQGYGTLSYFNYFEYGFKIQCPVSRTGRARPSSSAAQNDSDWKDANQFLKDHLEGSVLGDSATPTDGYHHGCHGSWQGAIVMDPTQQEYRDFLAAQMQRHFDRVPHFQGVVVDRSDWIRMYNLKSDDGISFINGTNAANFKAAFTATASAMRTIMNNNRHAVMLLNTYGFSALSLMEDFDGTFSEGQAVNAVGLLGVASPAILWTYDVDTCCKTQAQLDTYLQWRLYMGVYPMAPFPDADHSLPYTSELASMFADYGLLFKALHRKTWVLIAHTVNADVCKANAFYTSSGVVFTAVLADQSAQQCTLSIRSSVLQGYSANASYVRPGDEKWSPLPSKQDGDRRTVQVPLARGAAMVRFPPTA